MLCLNDFPTREYSVCFAAAVCLGWPLLPPQSGFLQWDELYTFSVLVVTLEVPISEEGSPNFQAEGGK